MSEFWKAILIRAIRQFCFTALGLIGSAVVPSDVDWKYVLSACTLSSIVTILTCIVAGIPEVRPAEEITEKQVELFDDAEPKIYANTEDYDDLHIDEEDNDDDDDQVE